MVRKTNQKTYNVYEVLFFANDRLLHSCSSKEQADYLANYYEEKNEDTGYRWYVVKEESDRGVSNTTGSDN